MKSGYFDNNFSKGEKFAVFTLLGIAGVVVFGSLFGLLVQFLWNATLVELFGISEISFWQSIGILVLAKLFFGFGSSGNSSKKNKERKRKSSMPWHVTSEEAHDLEEGELQQVEFRNFWEKEGRDAYEAFKAKDSEADDDAAPT